MMFLITFILILQIFAILNNFLSNWEYNIDEKHSTPAGMMKMTTFKKIIDDLKLMVKNIKKNLP